ncbi:hypothetical protein RhiirA4_470406 [Rhizophagus irregularis]|uniref:Uncharacterized protein n=1 Tax=Rhizophagus irregularis TaxID=588596 RepID=A0A2I1H175_9GLOM|nr:hypothetical protein RhiirA4_470406 [Rhizophagus irregularis]
MEESKGNKFTPKELKDCSECENLPYWTSRNKEIDKLIRYTQLNAATQACDYLDSTF